MPKLPGQHLLKRAVFVSALVALGFVLAWVRFQPQLGQIGRLTDGTRTLQSEGLEALRFAIWEDPQAFSIEGADGTERRPTSSPDGRWLVFAAGERGVAADLFLAEVIDGRPGPARRLDELSSRFDELAPSFAPATAGGGLWFASNRPGGAGGLDLYRATFEGGRCGAPERLPEPLNGPSQDTDPALDRAGRLAFASTRHDPAGRDHDLFLGLPAGAGWSVVQLDAFSTPFDERDPAFALGGGSLLFASRRGGDFDLYRSFEAETGWLTPEPLDGLNSAGDERGPAPREDGFALLFTRAGDAGPAAGGVLRATSRELYRTPSRPVGWQEILVIALLALLAFLAWAAQRWRGMDVLWRCVLISLLLHLALLWWFQRIHPEPSPVELDPNDGRIAVRLDLRPSAAARAARSERGGRPELARAEAAEGAASSAPERQASSERRELGDAELRSAEALTLAAPAVERAALPEAEPVRAQPSGRAAAAGEAPDLRAPEAPAPQAAVAPSAASALRVESAALAELQRGADGALGAERPERRGERAPIQLATHSDSASDASAPSLAPAPVQREALPAGEASRLAALAPGERAPRAAGALALDAPAAGARRGAEATEFDAAGGLASAPSAAAERRGGSAAAPAREPRAPAAAPAGSGPLGAAPELEASAGERAALSESAELSVAAPARPERTRGEGAGLASLEVAGPGAPAVAAAAEPGGAGPALELAGPAPRRTSAGATDAAPSFERRASSEPPAPTRAGPSTGLALAPSFSRQGLQGGAGPAPRALTRSSQPLANVELQPLSSSASAGVAAATPSAAAALSLAGPGRLTRRGSEPTVPTRGGSAAPRRELGPAVAAAAAPALAVPDGRRPELMPAPSGGLPDLERTPYRTRTGAAKELALETGGGSAQTEAAVASGLDYLARIQTDEGYWGRATNDHPKYGYTAVGKTGLCLLAFLGAGHTPTSGTAHSEVVARGIEFLLGVQGVQSGHFGDTSAYSHGIATYALAETFALTRTERYRPPLERAVARILRAQSQREGRAYFGGWSYYYPDDHQYDRWPRTSITAWQVMALESARLAGVAVPDQAFEDAGSFLRRARDSDLGAFRYSHDPDWVDGSRPTLPGSTPAALFALSLLGEDLEDPRYLPARQFVSERAPDGYRDRGETSFVRDATGNLYFWYYGSLALFRIGGAQWEAWNEGLKQTLLPAQNRDGSFDPISPYGRDYAYDRADDKSYSTAMAVLCLEVYYRYFTPLLQVK